MGLFSNIDFFRIFAGLICFAISLPVHEFAHGYVAYKLGDPTAKNMGRLTLNPIKHLDLFGAISMVFFGIGWAKPVQINPRNFRNPKAGMAISAAAGPISNLLLALVFMIIQKLMLILFAGVMFTSQSSYALASTILTLLDYLILINISLAIFNLLPIPPFDGSRIANYFLPERIYFQIMNYEQYIMIGVFVLLLTGVLDGPLSLLSGSLYSLLDKLTFFLG